MAPDMRRRELAIAQLNLQSTFEIADAIAGGPVATSIMGRSSLEASRAVGFDQDEAITGGPRGKTAKVAEKAGAREDIQRSDASAGRADVLRSCELCFKCVASGIRIWGYFRGITGKQDVPPSEEAALAWASCFSAGRTFQRY